MNSADLKTVMKMRRDKRQAESRGSKKDVADLCNALGVFLMERGQLEEALEEHQEELAVCQSLHDEMGMAVASRRVGDVQCERGFYSDALDQYELYLEAARRHCLPAHVQRATASIGRTHLLKAEECHGSRTSDVQKNDSLALADKWLNRGLTLASSLSDVSARERAEMEARLLLNLGIVCDSGSKRQQAREYYKRALSIASDHSLFDDMRRIHENMAYSYQESAEFSSSLSSLQMALQLADKLQLPCARSDILAAMATVHLTVGDTHAGKRALQHAFRQKHISEQQRDKHATALKHAVRLVRAEDALLLLPDKDHWSEQFRLHEKLADCYSQLSIFLLALQHYTQQLKCAEALSLSGEAIAPVYTSLAETCRDLHRYSEAKVWYQKELAAREGNDREICKTLINLACTEVHVSGRMESVCSFYRQAAQRAERAGLARLQVAALKDLADTLLDFNETQQSEIVMSEVFAVREKHGFKEDCEEDHDLDSQMTGESPDDSDDQVDLDQLTDISEDEGENDTPSDQCAVSIDVNRVRPRRPQRNSFKVKRNNKGETQLHVACISGRAKHAARLLESGHPVNARDNSGWLPIHEAANFGHLAVVQLLISAGAEVNDPGGEHCGGTTPLHDAAANGHVQCTRALLEAGAHVTSRNQQKQLPLHCLRSFKQSNEHTMSLEEMNDINALEEEMLSMLDQAGVVVSDGESYNEKASSPAGEFADDDNLDGAELISRGRKTCSRGRSSEYDEVDKHSGVGAMATEDATEMYRDAIKSVGVSALKSVTDDSRYSRRAGGRNKTSSRQRAHVDEQFYDWLDDDLGSANQTRRRRCVSPWLPTATNQRAGSSGTQSTARRASGGGGGGSKELSISRQSRGSSASRSVSSSDSDGDECGRTSVTCVSITDSSHSPPRKRHRQSRLTPLVQRRLTGGQSARSSSRSPSPVLAQTTPQSSSKPRLSIYDQSSTGSVRVQVELGSDRLLVPVPATVFIDGASNTPDISWLCNQVSERYHRKFLLRPFVELLKGDALLSSSDPVCDVISGQDDVIKCRVLRWERPPLTERYSSSCQILKQPEIVSIRACLARCDSERGTLDLSHQCLHQQHLPAVLKACHRCSHISALILNSNPLYDSGVQEVCLSLPHLNSLQLLDLSCVGMSLSGLSALCSAASDGCLSLCSSLLLAFNLFAASECGRSLALLIAALPALSSLDLSSCLLTASHVVSWREIFDRALRGSRLSQLVLSDNRLGAIALDLLLRAFSSDSLQTADDEVSRRLQLLAVDGCCEAAGQPVTAHLTAFASRSLHGCQLLSIDLSRCHLNTVCIKQLASGLGDFPALVYLNISDNVELCCLSSGEKLVSAAVSSRVPLRQLIVGGCSWDRSLHDQLDARLADQLQVLSRLQLLVLGVAPSRHMQQLVPETASCWLRKWPGLAAMRVTADGDLQLSVNNMDCARPPQSARA